MAVSDERVVFDHHELGTLFSGSQGSECWLCRGRRSTSRDEGRDDSAERQEREGEFLCVLFLEALLMGMGPSCSCIRCDPSSGQF